VAVPTQLLNTQEPGVPASAANDTPFDSSAEADIYVHVVGGVARPGLYRLSLGSRIIDAVMAAGGLASDGSQCGVNLARVVTDGEQVVVPQAPPGTPCRPVSASSGLGSPSSGSSGFGPVSLSTATLEQLDTLAEDNTLPDPMTTAEAMACPHLDLARAETTGIQHTCIDVRKLAQATAAIKQIPGPGEAIHLIAPEEAGVTLLGDFHLAQHLTNDDLNVLVIDFHPLQTIYLLNFIHQILLNSCWSFDRKNIRRCNGAI
jgi:DNA uptake protein ComE-like DNA-binding protein